MDLLSVLGNLASIIGMVISGFAFWKAKGAKEAAEQAKLEASRAVARVGSNLVENEVGSALRIARELLALCRARNWGRSLDRCDELRERLSSFRASIYLLPDEKKALGPRIDDIRVVQSAIERLKADRKALDLPGDDRELISRLIDILGHIEVRFRDTLLRIE